MFIVACYTVSAYTTDLIIPSIKSVHPYVDGVVVNASGCNWWGELVQDRITSLMKGLLYDDGTLQNIYFHFDNQWPQEKHRKNTIDLAKEVFPKMTHGLQIDDDEGWRPESIMLLKERLLQMDEDKYQFISWPRITFWKNYWWRLHGVQERSIGGFVWRPDIEFQRCKMVLPGQPDRILRLNPPLPPYYHFSYVRKSHEEIRRKMENFSHKSEIVDDWYERVWLGWKETLFDLHPTHPSHWKYAAKHPISDIPAPFKDIYEYTRDNWLV